MFSRNEILARLREGAEPMEIGQKMADELNAAIDLYEKEKKAIHSRVKARKAIDTLCDYFSDFFDDTVSEEDREQLTDTLMKMSQPAATDDAILQAFLKGLT